MSYNDLLQNIFAAEQEAKRIGESAFVEIHADADMLDYLVTLSELKIIIPKKLRSIEIEKEFRGHRVVLDNKTFVVLIKKFEEISC